MRTTSRLLTFLLLVAFQAQTQDLTGSVIWGKEFNQSNYNFTFLPRYDTSEWLAFNLNLVIGGTTSTIRKFSKEKSQLTSYDLLPSRLWFLPLKSKMYTLFEARNSEDNKTMFVDEFDTKLLRPRDKKWELIPATKEGVGVYFSNDRSKFLLTRRVREKKKGNKIVFSLFDDEIKLIWERELSLPDSVDLFRVGSEIVDDNGSVYLVAHQSDGKKFRLDNDKSNMSSELFTIKDNGKSFSRMPIKLESATPTATRLKLKGDTLLCIGFYSKKDRTGARGIFLKNVDLKSNELVFSSQKDFDKSLIVNNMIPSRDRANLSGAFSDDELSYFVLERVVLNKDNSLLLVAEQSYSYFSLGGRTSTHHDYYFFNNIFVMKIMPTGEVVWTTTIPKKQNTEDDAAIYSSFALAHLGDQMLFLFNDTPKNYQSPMSGKQEIFYGGDAVFVMALLDANGNIRKQIVDPGRTKAFIQPRECRQLNEHEIILYGHQKNIGQIGSLKIVR